MYFGNNSMRSVLDKGDYGYKGEGFGFTPDYWSTNNDILDTLIELTGDNDLSTLLCGLDKGLLF